MGPSGWGVVVDAAALGGFERARDFAPCVVAGYGPPSAVKSGKSA